MRSQVDSCHARPLLDTPRGRWDPRRSTLAMRVLSNMLATSGFLEAHVIALQTAMRTRCLAMVAAAETHLSGLAKWSVPNAGMFFWLELSREYDMARLAEGMRTYMIAVIPGEHFAADPRVNSGRRAVRLSYTIDVDLYDEAARKLAQLVQFCSSGQK
ncbi:aminotransferase class I/II-fold pyridoxal phosphate-dependent enzyme [bacterium]|nr:aminotransferase class I/II-fold pyridoxal phosphate-dependent enzyme [bacterium]